MPAQRPAGAEANGAGDEPELLLRRLIANDERSLRAVIAPTAEERGAPTLAGQALSPRTRGLIRVAALLATGAPTTSVRWAVELASGAGADEDALVGVLVAAAPAVGAARVVASAQRLALALGFDIEIQGWDGS